ncbi:MAG TPA: protein kinase, partial [Gemmatimonadales bacterium]|nr:protein kinase [Gemmatimonadales bacterium]
TVYLAHDLKHDRPVALKVLHAELAATLGPERFLREIKLAARLQHPHILSVHDSGETAGQLWFTMPYIEGESLRARLNREKQLPLDEALQLAREAAEALDYAHRHGVVHRDIKPDNILLSEGHALVADFGIGRALGRQQPGDKLTDVGMVVGTPAYMAPEQAMGEPTVDGRSDLYALGAVVFEMLAGEPPFTGPTAQVVLSKRFTGEVPRLRQFRPAVPEPLEQAVTRALALTPADRFQTVSEFGRALAASSPTPPSTPTILSAETRRTDRTAHRIRAPLLAVLGLGFLLGLGVLFAWRRSHSGAGDAGPKRIAVLPFVNLNRAEDEYFAEGITDDVRGKLAALSGMQVTARSSSSRYGKSTKSPQEIGRELGVEYLLTGTVRWDKGQAGRSRVRVSPELVQTATGSTSWQEAFEAPITDIFRVQADIAGRVARALDVALRAGQREQLAEKPTRDLAAYDLYLRGRHAWHRRTAEGLTQAKDLFEQAIRQDPNFARAHAGLADVYVVMPLWSDVAPSQTYPRAKAAALQALKLDSTLAEPEAALADVHTMYEWDWPAAERRFRRALALDSANANTHHWYAGDYLTAVGRLEDAIREERRARELDPLSPTINASVGINLYRAHRYDEALADLEAARSLDPDFTLANFGLGCVYLMQGRYDDAVEAFEKAVDPNVRHSADLAFLGYAYAKAGRQAEASRLLRELKDRGEQSYVSPTNIAVLLTGLGDTVAALQWLERAVQEHDPQLIYNFIPEPLLEGVRSRPEGAALVKRMGLPVVGGER